MGFRRQSLGFEVCISVLLTAAALLISRAIGGVVALEVPFFGAVIGSLWLAGSRAGAIATALSGLAIVLFHIPPLFRLGPADLETVLEVAGFLVVSGLMVIHTRALSITRDAMTATFRSIGDGVITTDVNGRVRMINAAAEALTGWTAEAAREHPLDEVLRTRNMSGPEVESEGLGGKLLIPLRGPEVPVEVTTTPITDSGRLAGYAVIVRDVGQRRQLERRMREEDKLRTIGGLTAGIAHQYNNLLTSVIGAADLAKSMLPKGHQADGLLADVITAGQRAANLTRQLLAYAGKGAFVIERVELASLVRQSAELVEAVVPPNVTLVVENGPEEVAVAGDPVQIQQILLNLVTNAAEAIRDGAGSIHVRTGPKGPEYAALEVEDTGCGMDETTRVRAFEPFFTTKFLGRGLGLAAVQGIARSYGGSIEVESAPGRGSRFVVLLPRAGKLLHQKTIGEIA